MNVNRRVIAILCILFLCTQLASQAQVEPISQSDSLFVKLAKIEKQLFGSQDTVHSLPERVDKLCTSVFPSESLASLTVPEKVERLLSALGYGKVSTTLPKQDKQPTPLPVNSTPKPKRIAVPASSTATNTSPKLSFTQAPKPKRIGPSPASQKSPFRFPVAPVTEPFLPSSMTSTSRPKGMDISEFERSTALAGIDSSCLFLIPEYLDKVKSELLREFAGTDLLKGLSEDSKNRGLRFSCAVNNTGQITDVQPFQYNGPLTEAVEHRCAAGLRSLSSLPKPPFNPFFLVIEIHALNWKNNSSVLHQSAGFSFEEIASMSEKLRSEFETQEIAMNSEGFKTRSVTFKVSYGGSTLTRSSLETASLNSSSSSHYCSTIESLLRKQFSPTQLMTSVTDTTFELAIADSGRIIAVRSDDPYISSDTRDCFVKTISPLRPLPPPPKPVVFLNCRLFRSSGTIPDLEVSENLDYSSYSRLVQAKIKEKWRRPSNISRSVTVLFEIDRSGNVNNIRRKNTLYDFRKLDDRYREAILLASPFPRLPDGSPKTVTFFVEFFGKQNRNKPPAGQGFGPI